jgi:hypothetical protein
MVKLGFIVEGGTEKRIIESTAFREYLISLNLGFVEAVIDAEGNGNLLPMYLLHYIQILKDQGANKIIILTDLDLDACITVTKNRINAPNECLMIVAVKTIEAWFLSDRDTLQKIINNNGYVCPNPETIDDPFKEIRQLATNTGRGLGTSKIRIADKFIKEGFSIVNAADHANCLSAQYFINKLNLLAANI